MTQQQVITKTLNKLSNYGYDLSYCLEFNKPIKKYHADTLRCLIKTSIKDIEFREMLNNKGEAWFIEQVVNAIGY